MPTCFDPLQAAGGVEIGEEAVGAQTVVLARVAQLCDVEWQCGGGDPVGVEWIGLTDTPIAPGAHPERLDYLIAGLGSDPGNASAISGDAFDHPESLQITTGPTSDPGDRPVQTSRRGGELLTREQFTGGCNQNCQVMSTGMGVDADDERVSMRNDGHGGRISFQQGHGPAAVGRR